MSIEEMLQEYADAQRDLNDIREEMPQIKQLEMTIEDLGKEIRQYVREHGPISGCGYVVTMGSRESWDGLKLKRLAEKYPEILGALRQTDFATIRKMETK